MARPARSMHMDIVERRQLGGSLYRVTIAASEKARQPPELEFAGLSTDNYSKNPVVMWAHDAVGRSPSGGLPIGRTLSLTKTPDYRIVADFEFLGDDPFAQRVKNAWDKGFLQAASISWLPIESAPIDGVWRDSRSDLLEWSIVSVPADPEALRESHRRLMDALLLEPMLSIEGGRRKGDERPAAAADPDPSDTTAQKQEANDLDLAERLLGLSKGDYEDLTTALALLRNIIGGVHRSGPAGTDLTVGHAPTSKAHESDLLQIKTLTETIKRAVLSS